MEVEADKNYEIRVKNWNNKAKNNDITLTIYGEKSYLYFVS